MQNSNAAGLDLFTLHPLNGNPSDFLYFALGFGPQPKMIYIHLVFKQACTLVGNVEEKSRK